MTESIKICAIGIICAILCVFIRNAHKEFAIPIRLAGIIIIFSLLIILINPIFNFLKNMMSESLPIEQMKLLAKSLCIAYITQISSELCRDCGENNIAFAIDCAGKIEIIILSIPLINQVIELSKEMIAW